MLLVALLLLLAAAGLLVASFVTGSTVWAWASIAVSGLAAAALVVRWFRLRRLRAARSGRHRSAEPVTVAHGSDRSDEVVTADVGPDERREDAPPPPPAEAPVMADPDEEDTDAADLLVVCELDDEVVVVDELSRYHLARCPWLGSRPTEPLPAREARDLGFTPCAICGPDAVLAQRYRAARSR